VRHLAEHASASHHAWEQAKKNDTFSIWAPYLKKTIALHRQKAQAIDMTRNPYEVLFSEYEHGLSLQEMQQFLTEMRDALVPLLKRVKEKKKIDDTPLLKKLSDDEQLVIAKKTMELVGYDFNKGRMDTSTHPFSAAFGRITTRFDKKWTEVLSCAMHEFGHAMYEHNLPIEHFGTPLGQAVSLGIHESQSRLWENHIGVSEEFWDFLLPHLQKEVNHFDGLDAHSVFLAVNRVDPGPIRVMADELTYTLHIIIRFELEQALIEGTIDADDLPEAWRKRYEDYLGITPSTDAQGCMQDVHWTESFGYFPTYSLGNMIAAQLYEAILRDIPDLKTQIRNGNFLQLHTWLIENVHKHGRKYSTKELVKHATGKELSTQAYITYLTEKFSILYELSQPPK
jgi:carboxypeptidase Taq